MHVGPADGTAAWVGAEVAVGVVLAVELCVDKGAALYDAVINCCVAAICVE